MIPYARQGEEGLLFGYPDVGVGGVAQHEPVEPLAMSGSFDRLVDRSQSRHQVVRILVVGRQQHGGPASNCRQRFISTARFCLSAMSKQHEEAGKRRGEGASTIASRT